MGCSNIIKDSFHAIARSWCARAAPFQQYLCWKYARKPQWTPRKKPEAHTMLGAGNGTIAAALAAGCTSIWLVNKINLILTRSSELSAMHWRAGSSEMAKISHQSPPGRAASPCRSVPMTESMPRPPNPWSPSPAAPASQSGPVTSDVLISS